MFIWVVVLGISSVELYLQREYLGMASITLLTIDLFFAMLVGIYFWKKISSNWMDWFFLFA
jgi:hypothetical protein